MAAALVGLHACTLQPDLRSRLLPGERGYAVVLATNREQARVTLEMARLVVERSPLLAPLVEGLTDDQIAFTTGMTFAAFPCSSRGSRGWAIHTLVLDELAHSLDTDGNSAAESVWRALVPSTAQFGKQARVIAASTPLGQDGLFTTPYQKAATGELEAHSAHATTAEANPDIDAADLEAERRRDPQGFASEYEAAFIGGGSAYLDPERIEDVIADRGELQPGQARHWIGGIDPAFSRDPFGLAIVGRDPLDYRRLVLGYARSWTPERSSSESRTYECGRVLEDELLREVIAECQRFGVDRVVTDQYMGDQISGRFRENGLRVDVVNMNRNSKTQMYGELKSRINLGTIELYRHELMIAEMKRLRTKFSGGSAAVDNPRVGGSHGDICQALAMAVSAHRYASDPNAMASIGYVETDLSRMWEESRPLRYDDLF